jgi:F420-dependent oxidoreductase-like protein
MRIGLQIPSFTWPGGAAAIGPKLAEIAKTADDCGLASLWVMDHFFQIQFVGKPDEPMLEGYTALSYMAAFTKRARLGTMVTGVVYRHPGILVKEVTTLDVLSGGRAYLGIGAAWNEQESKGLGIPFPPLKERFERLEEALQIALQMWAGKVEPYNGKHYQPGEPINSPQPISKPHPPILIGGGGEKKTLQLVAKYADACNLFARMGPDALRQKLDVLKAHCEKVGRNYNEIEKTVLDTINLSETSVKQVVDFYRDLSKLGIQHAIVNMPNVHDLGAWSAKMEQLVREVADL